jgi:hypothetical protein
MSQLTVNTLQLGQSATPANNFVLAMPSPQDGTIKLSRGNVGSTTQDVISVNAAGQVSFPATGSFGKILQVVQTVKTTLFSTSATSFTDITGLSASITPTSASNNVLVIANIKAHASNNCTSRILRDSTPIFVGTDATGSQVASSGGDFYGSGGSGGAAGGSGQTVTHTFLDSPATTSAVTYKAQVQLYAGTFYLNATYANGNSSFVFKGASSIILMEVAP